MPESNTDNPVIDGLPDDVRAELVRLAAQSSEGDNSDSTEGGDQENQTPPANQRQPRGRAPRQPAQANDQPPAWVAGLTETLAGLTAATQQQAESNRVLQGQVRRMETRDTNPQPKPQADPLAGIDLEDPSTAALARLLTAQNAEIASLKSLVGNHQASFAMDAERRAWYEWAREMASELDVPFTEVEAELSKIGSDRFATDGRKVITTASKKSRGKKAESGDGDTEVTERAQNAIKLLQDMGMWDDIRTTLIGGRGGDAEADYRALERQNSNGDLDIESIKNIAKRYS